MAPGASARSLKGPLLSTRARKFRCHGGQTGSVSDEGSRMTQSKTWALLRCLKGKPALGLGQLRPHGKVGPSHTTSSLFLFCLLLFS